jgi:hypothetical protein
LLSPSRASASLGTAAASCARCADDGETQSEGAGARELELELALGLELEPEGTAGLACVMAQKGHGGWGYGSVIVSFFERCLGGKWAMLHGWGNGDWLRVWCEGEVVEC